MRELTFHASRLTHHISETLGQPIDPFHMLRIIAVAEAPLHYSIALSLRLLLARVQAKLQLAKDYHREMNL
jgi:hypothetical protein